MMTFLIDSGASQKSANLAALKRVQRVLAICQYGIREKARVMLANCALVKSEGVKGKPASSVSDSCISKSSQC